MFSYHAHTHTSHAPRAGLAVYHSVYFPRRPKNARHVYRGAVVAEVVIVAGEYVGVGLVL